jgi:hypothetical protein
MIQLTAGIWKLGGIRKTLKIRRCHLHLGEEDVKHIKMSGNKKVDRETCTYRTGEKSPYTHMTRTQNQFNFTQHNGCICISVFPNNTEWK